ncbi:uncharacterized protein K452DRAFT_286025 [Aplosporella prunicola CBS 121167]|uniref:Fungal STAND N-terminal Goodbye domain-containing protein n=1 Tax=Aplosporella prunicola CBS 121167 TaxID=1176127 RepID=A0A6A6BGU5_9PEZI|nr:uncharacterized protein K452DRAFT_286025 [Aplosporella prunicola CBS 121167]KAF2143196.1 hypothetical protein K452DRAFT_286025 [Aplosporella prunicola CBS 121167]
MYSFEVEERLPQGNVAHNLGSILSESKGDLEDLTAPWRKFFEPWKPSGSEKNPVTVALTQEAEALRKRWLEFRISNPEVDRVDLQRSEPTAQDLVDLVEQSMSKWQERRSTGRRGKAMSFFRQFCRSINSHKAVMGILPEGNEYVSLFTGTLNAVVKASVNHEKIAEGVSQALATIGENVANCQNELEVFPSEPMQHAVAALYVGIFKFLQKAMTWIMSSRRKKLLDSFNENFYEHFEDDLAAIQNLTDNVRRKFIQGSAAEQRVTRQTVEDTNKKINIDRENNEHFQNEMRTQFQLQEQFLIDTARRLEQPLDKLYQMLQGLALDRMKAEPQSSTFQMHPSPHFALTNTMPTGQAMLPSTQISTNWSKENVTLNSTNLEDYFHRDRIRLPSDPFDSMMVQQEALARLTEWTKDPKQSILSLSGPAMEADDFENPMTMLAAKFAEFADRSGVKIISYFCELRRGEKTRSGNTRESQALISLAYSLVRQTVELLPSVFQSDADFSEEKFQQLDGTEKSWTTTLEILHNLLPLLPDKVFFMIDGFQWLDDRSTAKLMKDLLMVLRKSNMKVLFTTSGDSRCLLGNLSRSEMVLVNEVGPTARGSSVAYQRF